MAVDRTKTATPTADSPPTTASKFRPNARAASRTLQLQHHNEIVNAEVASRSPWMALQIEEKLGLACAKPAQHRTINLDNVAGIQ
mmetsp:Transcript_66218/g.144360  ORF Transcript_66218/g.144360 Transcript_66218/m.144360 type:complete len:85 (-) Transcript_66218:827-1081(-)